MTAWDVAQLIDQLTTYAMRKPKEDPIRQQIRALIDVLLADYTARLKEQLETADASDIPF